MANAFAESILTLDFYEYLTPNFALPIFAFVILLIVTFVFGLRSKAEPEFVFDDGSGIPFLGKRKKKPAKSNSKRAFPQTPPVGTNVNHPVRQGSAPVVQPPRDVMQHDVPQSQEEGEWMVATTRRNKKKTVAPPQPALPITESKPEPQPEPQRQPEPQPEPQPQPEPAASKPQRSATPKKQSSPRSKKQQDAPTQELEETKEEVKAKPVDVSPKKVEPEKPVQVVATPQPPTPPAPVEEIQEQKTEDYSFEEIAPHPSRTSGAAKKKAKRGGVQQVKEVPRHVPSASMEMRPETAVTSFDELTAKVEDVPVVDQEWQESRTAKQKKRRARRDN